MATRPTKAPRPQQARTPAAASPKPKPKPKPKPSAASPKPKPSVAPAKQPASPKQPAAPAKPVSAEPQPASALDAPVQRPVTLRLAAAILAIEAAGMCVAAVFSAVSTADGQSYQRASGVALTLIAVGTAALFALFAWGLAQAKPWTRTPVVMTQVFIGAAAVYLFDGPRPEWGVPTLVLALACLACLFTPASLRALNRPPRTP